jgi:histidine triad (HIT) family protein
MDRDTDLGVSIERTGMSMTDPDCLFCKIVAGDIPAAKVLETDDVLVFRDIAPQAPVHLLAVPKLHIRSMADMGPDDSNLLGDLIGAANEAAGASGLGERGYRIASNVGEEAGQTVLHLHLHIMGGAPLGPLAMTDHLDRTP